MHLHNPDSPSKAALRMFGYGSLVNPNRTVNNTDGRITNLLTFRNSQYRIEMRGRKTSERNADSLLTSVAERERRIDRASARERVEAEGRSEKEWMAVITSCRRRGWRRESRWRMERMGRWWLSRWLGFWRERVRVLRITEREESVVEGLLTRERTTLKAWKGGGESRLLMAAFSNSVRSRFSIDDCRRR